MAVDAVRPYRADWKRGRVTAWLTTVDHKRIGILYIVTSLGFFVAGRDPVALHAGAARDAERALRDARPLQRALHDPRDDDGLPRRRPDPRRASATTSCPLMIGARDMAFPRLNAFSYWMFLLGGIVLYSSFFAAGGPAKTGWTAYVPLSENQYAPGHGQDLWILVAAPPGRLLARGRDQLHRDDPQHARRRDELDADAALRLGDRGLRLPARRHPAGARRRPPDAPPRPAGRHALLPPGRRAATRSSTSTSSGSSGTPRSTS